jgi:hypothetical protein
MSTARVGQDHFAVMVISFALEKPTEGMTPEGYLDNIVAAVDFASGVIKKRGGSILYVVCETMVAAWHADDGPLDEVVPAAAHELLGGGGISAVDLRGVSGLKATIAHGLCVFEKGSGMYAKILGQPVLHALNLQQTPAGAGRVVLIDDSAVHLFKDAHLEKLGPRASKLISA